MNDTTLTLIDVLPDSSSLYKDRDGVCILYRQGCWYRKTEFDSWYPVARV